jgi:glucose-6-phosphate isomerase
MNRLRLDATSLTASGLGAAGIGETELDAIATRAAAAVDRTRALRAQGAVGFLDLPDDRAGARATLDFARGVDPAIDSVVVLGIGGSSLGPQALFAALAPPLDGLRARSPGMPRRLFFPDNPDPATMRAVLDTFAPERTLWNVVTKSGGTAETAAQLMVVWAHLQRALGTDGARRHVVVTTDPEGGPLRRIARERGLAAFPIPPAVGGRFSALSAVGLLPAALAGLDVMGLLDGARAMRDRVIEGDTARDVRQNPALLLAALLHLHHVARGRPLVVMMTYADALYPLGLWFQQLWGESLGKEHDTEGRTVHVGPTPIAARGATDQHSQLQLYVEGPADKVILFVTTAERGVEVAIPAGDLGDEPELGYLAGHGLGELLDAELCGTARSLTRRGRPNATITLARIDAPAVGELLMLFEAATAFAGPLYGIDPYDQPGVEEAKRLAYAALGRPGYEAEAADLAAASASDPRYVR